MTAKLIGMFSGFPQRRFPADIAQRLKSALTDRENLAFISAWPDEYERNDEDAAGMHGMFAQWDMGFAHFAVIDRRMASEEAQRLLCGADCVFLMGGNPTEQMRLIREIGLVRVLRDYRGVLLGVSAGAINMARRALDVWESRVPYEGLGLTGITIKSHVNPGEQQLLQTLREISVAHCLPICAMEDESAIFISEGRVDWAGCIRYVEGGEVGQLTQELLNRLTHAE